MSYLANVNITSPSTNDTLLYDGTKWVNLPLAGSTVTNVLASASKYYVDNVLGDDTNDGLTALTPLATIAEATLRSKDVLNLQLVPSASAYSLSYTNLNYGAKVTIFNSTWGAENRTTVVDSGTVSGASTFYQNLYSSGYLQMGSFTASGLTASSYDIMGCHVLVTSGAHSGTYSPIIGVDGTTIITYQGFNFSGDETFQIVKPNVKINMTGTSYFLQNELQIFGCDVNITGNIYSSDSRLLLYACRLYVSDSSSLVGYGTSYSISNSLISNRSTYLFNNNNTYEHSNKLVMINSYLSSISQNSLEEQVIDVLASGSYFYNSQTNANISYQGRHQFNYCYILHPITFNNSTVQMTSCYMAQNSTWGYDTYHVFKNSSVSLKTEVLIQKDFAGSTTDLLRMYNSRLICQLSSSCYMVNADSTGDGIKLYDSEIFVENFLKYKNASAGSSFMTLYGNSNVVNMDTLFSTPEASSLTYGYVLYDNSSILVGTSASSISSMGTVRDEGQSKTITTTTLNSLAKPYIIRANDESKKIKVITSDTTLTDSMGQIIANSGTSTVTIPTVANSLTGKKYGIKNNSGGSLSVVISDASTTIRDTSSTLVSSVSMISGSSATYVNSGTYWEML